MQMQPVAARYAERSQLTKLSWYITSNKSKQMKRAKTKTITKLAKEAGFSTAKDDSIIMGVEIGETFVLIDDANAVISKEEKRKAILVANGANIRILYFKQLARVARIKKDSEPELLDGGEPSKEWFESSSARAILKKWVADPKKRGIKCIGYIDHYRIKFEDGKPQYDGNLPVLEQKKQPIWKFVEMTDDQYEAALKAAGLLD